MAGQGRVQRWEGEGGWRWFVITVYFSIHVLVLCAHVIHGACDPCVMWFMWSMCRDLYDPCVMWFMRSMCHVIYVIHVLCDLCDPCVVIHVSCDPCVVWSMCCVIHVLCDPCVMWSMCRVIYVSCDPCVNPQNPTSWLLFIHVYYILMWTHRIWMFYFVLVLCITNRSCR